jgi:hypothetical protein
LSFGQVHCQCAPPTFFALHFSLLNDSIGFNLLRMTKEQCYRVLLWLTIWIFLRIWVTSGVVYQSYRQCKVMEIRRLRHWERYLQIKKSIRNTTGVS